MNGEPEIGDAFGAALLAYFEAVEADAALPQDVARDSWYVIERDDGFIDIGDPSHYFASDPSEWNGSERWAFERVGSGRVLDIGCGAGRHALALQAAGSDVTGLDISPLAIEVCRRRGLEQAFAGDLDAFAATGAGQFDTFLLLGNNLGLLAGQAGAPALMRSIDALAAPGARIVGTVFDPYQGAAEEHLQNHQRNREMGRHPGQSRIRTRYRSLATEWFDYLLTTLDELADLLEGTGWTSTESQKEGPNQAVVLVRA